MRLSLIFTTAAAALSIVTSAAAASSGTIIQQEGPNRNLIIREAFGRLLGIEFHGLDLVYHTDNNLDKASVKSVIREGNKTTSVRNLQSYCEESNNINGDGRRRLSIIMGFSIDNNISEEEEERVRKQKKSTQPGLTLSFMNIRSRMFYISECVFLPGPEVIRDPLRRQLDSLLLPFLLLGFPMGGNF